MSEAKQLAFRQIESALRKAEPTATIAEWALEGHTTLTEFIRTVSNRGDVPADLRLRAHILAKRWGR